MKKLLSVLFSLFLMAGIANATTVTDVKTNYWAAKEIAACIRDGIIRMYADGSFRPEALVKRAEFNSMLLRALGHKPTTVEQKNPYKDLNNKHWAYNDIMKSQQIGLLYGYPDGKFRADNLITKTEVASILSHITKDVVDDITILEQYTDKDKIPYWGVHQYAKTIELGMYVNYPKADELLPNKELNRAEAAVILHRLRTALGMVQEKYLSKEIVETEAAKQPEVKTKNDDEDDFDGSNFRKIVLSSNVMRAAFDESFIAEISEDSNIVKFVVVNDIFTEQGALLIPRASVLTAKVKLLDEYQDLNAQTHVSAKLKEIIFPTGKIAKVSGQVIDKKGILTAARLASLGKHGGFTLGSAASGSGSGIGIAAIPNQDDAIKNVSNTTNNNAKKASVVTGLVTPGLPYMGQTDETLVIELIQNFGTYDDVTKESL